MHFNSLLNAHRLSFVFAPIHFFSLFFCDVFFSLNFYGKLNISFIFIFQYLILLPIIILKEETFFINDAVIFIVEKKTQIDQYWICCFKFVYLTIDKLLDNSSFDNNIIRKICRIDFSCLRQISFQEHVIQFQETCCVIVFWFFVSTQFLRRNLLFFLRRGKASLKAMCSIDNFGSMINLIWTLSSFRRTIMTEKLCDKCALKCFLNVWRKLCGKYKLRLNKIMPSNKKECHFSLVCMCARKSRKNNRIKLYLQFSSNQ